MRVRVHKPNLGKVTVILDDRGGTTGEVTYLKDLPVEDVVARVTPVLAEWAQKRAQIRQLRRGIVP